MAYDFKAEERKAKKALLKTKEELRVALVAAGVAFASADYQGEGDDGNVEDSSYVDANKEEAGVDDDLDVKFRNFAWECAYSAHPGFENNDGGRGTVTFNVAENKVIIEHFDIVHNEEACEDVAY